MLFSRFFVFFNVFQIVASGVMREMDTLGGLTIRCAFES